MSALSPRQMFLLDEACRPIADSIDTPYLVGTAAHRGVFRDVDVRLMLSDKKYKKLKKAIGKQGIYFLGLAIGQYLHERTDGLPVDFQIQQLSAANAEHDGLRNPLGHRTLLSYQGDTTPIKKEKN